MAVSVVILKPTKACNASCTYCSAPPEVNAAHGWTLDLYARYLEAIKPGLSPGAMLIWHGGEPMLMGPDFYNQVFEHTKGVLPFVRHSMQTNLLLYSTQRWKTVFDKVLGRRISTSFDPDERHREYKGSVALYTRLFMERLDWAIADGIRPLIIGTYSEDTIEKAFSMYDWAKAKGDRAPSLRFNYRYPAGRDTDTGASLSPQTYGEVLIALYERWMRDVPEFQITPLDQMFKKTIGLESSRCPWLNDCGGKFLEIEPNGDVYNCSEFADIDDPQWRYGNLDVDSLAHLMSSPAAIAIRRRRYDLPDDCRTCPHFAQCEGGCMRDSVLYGRGLGGKFYYCQSWKMVFTRIKRSIVDGEADTLIRRYGQDVEQVRLNVRREMDALAA